MHDRKVRSILVIDDDRDDFEIVSEAVLLIDPQIVVSFLDRCEDGGRYKDQTFDIILLDINMPRHDGFDWLEGIRRHGYGNLPVIMYTSSSSPENIERAYHSGANLYFTKPESFASLVKGLKKLIEFDWTDPYSITQMHYQNGRYTTLQVA